MTMTELKQYMIENKRVKVAQWNKERAGNYCGPFTSEEFNQSMAIEKVKSRTRRTHSKGNLWSFNNTRDRERFTK